jgi:hypothetical protein
VARQRWHVTTAAHCKMWPRYLLHTGDNVKLGAQILLRAMRNPMAG